MTTNNSWNSQIPVEVAKGGTGRVSNTAYTVLCGGTGPTTPQQNISSVGTLGQILTSAGPGALPQKALAPVTYIDSQFVAAGGALTFLDILPSDGTFLFWFYSVRPATNGATFSMQFSSDSGASWTTNLQSQLLYNKYSSTTNFQSSSTTGIPLCVNMRGASTSHTGSGQVYYSSIPNALGTVTATTSWADSTAVMNHGRAGSLIPVPPALMPYDSVRFIMSSGVFLGYVVVYSFGRNSPI